MFRMLRRLRKRAGRVLRSAVGRRRSHSRRRNPWRIPVLGALALMPALLLFCWPSGCGKRTPAPPVSLSDQVMRVRLFQSQQQVQLEATASPVYYTSSDATPRRLELPAGVAAPLRLGAQGWQVGATPIGRGEVLVLRPSGDGTLRINGQAWRGEFRLVATGPDRFDLVNHVDIEQYLQSVVSRELFAAWHEETYKAQAIAARTYALYEKHANRSPRHWDVHADVRSQVYGGMGAETPKSRATVAATRGMVLAHGPAGSERIFKAYFSSCCGGVTQSAEAAFRDAPQQPLSEQAVGALCSASPRYLWGPVVIDRAELTARFRQWGANRNRPERDMATVRTIEIAQRNRYGRPTQFVVTDMQGRRYAPWAAEELRWAVNTSGSEGTTLYSSFVENIVVESDRVRFIGGRGHGHGVGLCQWCAEARARSGMSYDQIVLQAYPGSRLVRAYP